MRSSWDGDTAFGLASNPISSGGPTSTAPAPGWPASSTIQPAQNALRALLDPRGSAIFWIAVAAILGLAMVHGQLSISGRVRTRAGK